RRGVQRRQAGPRFAWQDADCGGGRKHTRGQSQPLESSPRERVPPRPKRDLWAAPIPPPPHPCHGQPAPVSRGRQRRPAPPPRHPTVHPSTNPPHPRPYGGPHPPIKTLRPPPRPPPPPPPTSHPPPPPTIAIPAPPPRYALAAMMPPLGFVAVRPPPMPY